jgi:DNA-binding transcriptional LysR family regulator
VSGRWSDTIVVACTATSVGSYLTDFLAEWIPAHPDTRLSMVEGDPRQTRRRLAEHECDVAIVALPLEREFDSLPLAHAQVEVLIPPGHRFERGAGPLLVDELAGEPVVMSGSEYRSGQLLRSACRVAGVHLEVVFECSVGFTLAALVRAGLGLGVVSTAVQRGDYELATRPLVAAGGKVLGFDLQVAWARDRVPHPMLTTFVTDLSEFTRTL